MSHPDPPRVIGARYRVLHTLGAGAFGTVHLAIDEQLGREVAIKTVRLEGLAATLTDTRGLIERFRREARLAAQLRHPGIVTIYDIGEDQGLSYIAMEYVAGQTLAEVIAEARRLPPERAAALAAQAARALGHAHGCGVVHRDIKPANILVEPGDHVKVTDFGIAKPMGDAEQLTAEGSLLGTPAYMSPEQARGEAVDGRSDVFSLGSVLYEMVTGRRAFQGESITGLLFKVLTEEPATPSDSVPPALARIIRRAMAKAPDGRYATGAEMAVELECLTGVAAVPTLREQDVPTVDIAGTAATVDLGAADRTASSSAATATHPAQNAPPTSPVTATHPAQVRRQPWLLLLLAALAAVPIGIGLTRRTDTRPQATPSLPAAPLAVGTDASPSRSADPPSAAAAASPVAETVARPAAAAETTDAMEATEQDELTSADGAPLPGESSVEEAADAETPESHPTRRPRGEGRRLPRDLRHLEKVGALAVGVVVRSEHAYRRRHGRWASFEELLEASPPRDRGGRALREVLDRGYRFEVVTNQHGFEVHAIPRREGLRGLQADQDGVVTLLE